MGTSSPRAIHTICCSLAGEQPSSIATAAASTAHLSKTLESDEYYMQLALDQAQLAYKAGEVPVGAIIVSPTGDVIAAAHNATEHDGDPTAHAEMLCIRHATGRTKAWRLLDATMYVTLEPCPMCAGALLQARVGKVVYGARNNLLGADGSWISMMRGGKKGETDRSIRSEGKEKENEAEGGGLDVLENVDEKEGEKGRRRQQEETSATTSSSSSLGALQPHRPHPFHPDLQVHTGILEEQCSALMKDFFKERRMQNAALSSVNSSDGGGEER